MASSTSPTQALCLLLVVIFVALGATSATAAAVKDSNTKIKIQPALPGSCLMAASTLCTNADTNAMRCLRKLAIKHDARVPSACSEALMVGVTMKPRRKQASRTTQLARLLTEAGNCNNPGGNTCPPFATHKNDFNARCNDVLAGCGGCAGGTITIPTTRKLAGLTLPGTSNDISCGSICCEAVNGNAACCATQTSGTLKALFCINSSHTSGCNLA